MSDQGHFDFLVPVTKELLRVDEVMTILRLKENSIYDLITEGKLEAHQNDGRRCVFRITRRSVIAHLAATAKYAPTDYVDTLFHLIRRLPAGQRQNLIKKASAIAA
jgi:hypothetical protein